MASRVFFLGVLVVLLPLLIVGCENRFSDGEQFSRSEKIVVRFSHVVPQNTPKGLAAKRFAELVHKRTDGFVEVQVFPNSTLFKDGEEFEALKNGKVHFIAPVTSKLGKMFPRWQVFDLPFAFKNRQEVHRMVESEHWEKLSSDLRQENMKALAFWDNGFKQLTSDKREIRSPEDFRGMNFRVMINSNLLKDQFSELGAIPVPMPFSEVYGALQEGKIDGQENTMSNIYSKKFYKQQSYMTVSNHGYLGYVVLTNSEFWEELPGEIREILRETMEDVTRWEREKAREINRKNYEELLKIEGLNIHVLTEEEKRLWKVELHPLYEDYREIIGDDLMDSLNNM